MNNIGIGVDIENTAQFKKRREKQDPFWQRIFTPKEVEYCFSKKNPAPHLAARYAGKEAVIKALSNLNKIDLNYTDYKNIEIFNEKNGMPCVKLNGLNSKDLIINISLSHCEDKALAFVIILKKV